MNSKRTTLAVAVSAALGVTALVPSPASAAQLVPNGEYRLVINPTPTFAAPSGTVGYVFGNQTRGWNSSFTFGGAVPGSGSDPLTDNGVTVPTNGGLRGSGISGDGYAGSLIIDVAGNSFTVKSFNVDTILGTAGGNFVEYTDSSKSSGPDTTGTSAMSGTIQATGAMTLDPTGRLGAVANYSSLYDEAWNISDGGTAYQTITTGTATLPNGGNSITGIPLTAISGTNNYQGTLVSGTTVGTAWGPFTGDPYFEVWNVSLLMGVRANSDTAVVISGVATKIDVLDNDTAQTGTSVIVAAKAGSASHGTVTVLSSGPFTLSTCQPSSCPSPIQYQSTAGYTGGASFTYTLTGSHGTTATGTVNVTVKSAGTALANPVNTTTAQGVPVPIDVLASDTDSTGKKPPTPPVTVHVVSSSSKRGGTLTVDSSNQIVYTPPAGYVGSDSFTYTFTDSAGKTSLPATVKVMVNAAFQAATSSVSVGPGAIAKQYGTLGLVTAQDLYKSSAHIPLDPGVSKSCIGGCFDFKVTNVGFGGQAKVAMLPLAVPIPSGARFRKYIKGKWQPFDTSNGDSFASAPGSATLPRSCPPPSSTKYQTGRLVVGYYCVRLAITDGGLNDGDGTAGTITDPSGIATGTGSSSTSAPTTATDFKGLGSGGCALGTDANPWHGGSWWLIGGMIGWLGFSRRRRSSQQS